MQPPTSDSETVWSDYKRQLEADVETNGRTSQEKETAITLALKIKDLEIISTIPDNKHFKRNNNKRDGLIRQILTVVKMISSETVCQETA